MSERKTRDFKKTTNTLQDSQNNHRIPSSRECICGCGEILPPPMCHNDSAHALVMSLLVDFQKLAHVLTCWPDMLLA